MALVAGGIQVVCLLALSDRGAPGMPTFACTPDIFPYLMAAAIPQRDLNL